MSKRRKASARLPSSLVTNENPLLAVLGATPRGASAGIVSTSSASSAQPSSFVNQITKKQKLNEDSSNDPSCSSSNVTERIGGLKDHIIAPPPSAASSGNAASNTSLPAVMMEPPLASRVVHKTSEVVIPAALRREIVIQSPSTTNNPSPPEVIPSPPQLATPPQPILPRPRLGFDCQPQDLIIHIFGFLVESEDLATMSSVSRGWKELTENKALCRVLDNITTGHGVNWFNFQNLGIKNKGTEGTCFKVRQRSTGRLLAMKRARVFPTGEGVPYYMLRELAVLQGMSHRHIASLELVSLSKDQLHVFFPYVDTTLHEIINPDTSSLSATGNLSEDVIRRLLFQLLDAMAYCHRRGVLHRNLKPKHLLIDIPDDGRKSLDEAVLQVSDFALVRSTGVPRRQYTMEVVTLWYRPPEILMGVRGYSPAVDVWSIGCIFAEMVRGKPLFTGISEIDQLFQIFSKLTTPVSSTSPHNTAATWEAFASLPNYGFEFPNWKHENPFKKLFPNLSHEGLDLMKRLLTYDPDLRISAEEALRHPYFLGSRPEVVPISTSHNSSSPHAEHTELYYQHLKSIEGNYARASGNEKITYLSRQRTLRPMHRAMLVDWLIEVVDVFEMCLRTAFLAVNYTDRFLNSVMVCKNKFQLLGATSLHVASKCEDVSYIGVEDLAMCADNVYTSAEVLAMEESLLNTLDFALSVPTTLDFLNIYKEKLGEEFIENANVMFSLATFCAELSLQEYQFLKFSPSVIATCCVSLAMYVLSEEHSTYWNDSLEEVSGFRFKELEECMTELIQVYKNFPFAVLLVVKKRYLKEERHSVASITPPSRFNMNFEA